MLNIITRRWCYNAKNNNKGDKEVTKWVSMEWWQQLLTRIGIYFSPINFWAILYLSSTQSNQIRTQSWSIKLASIDFNIAHTHTHTHIYIYIGLWVIQHNLRPTIIILKVTFSYLNIIYLNFNIIVFFFYIYLKSIFLNFWDTKLLIKLTVSNISLSIIWLI